MSAERTKEIVFGDLSAIVKAHHAISFLTRLLARVKKARLDRRIRRELERDGFTVITSSNGDWHVDVESLRVPAQLSLGEPAFNRLLDSIASSKKVVLQ